MTRTDEPAAGISATVTSADGVVLTVAGEFDRDNSHQLFTAVRQAVAAGHPVIILDLRGVRFLDASTIRILLDCNEIAARAGRALRVVRPAGVPGQVLDIGVSWARLR